MNYSFSESLKAGLLCMKDKDHDAQVVCEIAVVSDDDELHKILHYLYVPNSEAAGIVAADPKQSGFQTEVRFGADGVNWVVLARHEGVPTSELMASIRHSVETLTVTVGGEYDGGEADVQHHGGYAH